VENATIVYSRKDGSDLLELLKAMWRQKLFILLITMLTVVFGFIYILIAKPRYEALAYLAPAHVGDIAAFNSVMISNDKDNLIPPFTIESVYELLMNEVESTKRTFFNEVYLPTLPASYRQKKSRAQLYKQFDQHFKITKLSSQTRQKIKIVAKANNKEQAAEWINRYIDLVRQKTTKDVLEITEDHRDAVVKILRKEIDMAREVTKQHRNDRLVQLNEALNIAQKIGLKHQTYTTAANMPIEVTAANEPSLLYRRGSIALEAEIQNIKIRKSNEAFVPNLRKLQSQYNFYKNIKLDPGVGKVFSMDGKVEISDVPISPNKGLILTLSFAMGLLLGSFLALLRIFRSMVYLSTQ